MLMPMIVFFSVMQISPDKSYYYTRIKQVAYWTIRDGHLPAGVIPAKAGIMKKLDSGSGPE